MHDFIQEKRENAMKEIFIKNLKYFTLKIILNMLRYWHTF